MNVMYFCSIDAYGDLKCNPLNCRMTKVLKMGTRGMATAETNTPHTIREGVEIVVADEWLKERYMYLDVYEEKGSARRQHLRRVDVRRGKQTRFERLEIRFLDVGDGGDQDACKTEGGRVVDNAGRDDEHKENTEDSGVDGAAGGWQRRGEGGEAGFEFREARHVEFESRNEY
ncbi:hypothetical protein B0H13DRAFT_2442080 [Mycena leptocephala]|nr:hypothetical protein B0H13DRAFT_2442080 [Mycena leptocephala]